MSQQEPIITSDELIDLAENLRGLGFAIDTRQCLLAHATEDILLTLDLKGELGSAERLRTVLAPIFCGKPDEQETFYAYFDEWLERNPRITERFKTRKKKTPPTSTPTFFGKADATKRPFRPWPLALAFVILIFGIAAGLYYLFSSELRGKVIDAVDGFGIENALVYYPGGKIRTDASGNFAFSNLHQNKTVKITIQHEQYQTKTTNINIDSFGNSISFNLWKKDSLKLTGVVKNERTLEPIESVHVSFLDQIAKTDSNGTFVFPYQSGDDSAQILCRHEGYSDASVSVQLNGGDRSDIEILQREKQPEYSETQEITQTRNNKQDQDSSRVQESIESPERRGILPNGAVSRDGEESLSVLVQRINNLVDSMKPKIPEGSLLKFLKWFHWLRFSSVALPVLIFLTWFFSRWRRMRIYLEKQTTSEARRIESVVVKGLADHLFRNSAFRDIIQKYGRHREVMTSELKVSDSVNATIQNGGFFEPVFASRFLLPEYLILIDRLSFNDQHALFIDEFVRRMAKDGVLLDRYYFKGDPRICRPENPGESHITLRTLHAKRPDSRLLIFSDASGFIDARTGKPRTWVRDFPKFAGNAIFIPEKIHGADYLEMVFGKEGWDVQPANSNGLTRYIKSLQVAPDMNPVKWERDAGFPELLEERTDLWLERHPPEENLIEDLFEGLQDYLKDEGMYWLKACAVYPELHWELTLYLATMLKMKEERILKDQGQVLLQKRLLYMTRQSEVLIAL